MRVGDSMYGGVENVGPQCVFCVGSTRSCCLCVGDERFRSHVDIMSASALLFLFGIVRYYITYRPKNPLTQTQRQVHAHTFSCFDSCYKAPFRCMKAQLIRALERCCVCQSYFPTRESAPKRRKHMEACARFSGVSEDALQELVLQSAAQVLGAWRAEKELQSASCTLFRKMIQQHTPDRRLAQLSAIIGPHLDACAMGPAAKENHAVRASSEQILSRLCVHRKDTGPASKFASARSQQGVESARTRLPSRSQSRRTHLLSHLPSGVQVRTGHQALAYQAANHCVSLDDIAAELDRRPSPCPPPLMAWAQKSDYVAFSSTRGKHCDHVVPASDDEQKYETYYEHGMDRDEAVPR